jgi:hypothetical protein
MPVLRKLVAKGCPNVRIALADKIVCGCKPGEVGHSLQVPHTMTLGFMQTVGEQLGNALIEDDCRTLVRLAEQFDVTYFTISPRLCGWPHGRNV